MRAKTLFDDAVYTRGALTLQALRERVGSRVFFRILRRWASDHRHGTGTTAAFVRLAQQTSGRRLGKLFHDWLSVAKRPRGYLR
jgi:aminopeptidase N